MDNFIISVITVSYNSEDTIEKTIQSVISQSNINFEYIIIDGKSTDSTLKIVNKYKDKISCIISEKDSGLYDAMNKGIKLAHGKYINFMNCGDSFVNNNVLNEMSQYMSEPVDVVYGNVNILTPNGEFKVVPMPLDKLKDMMPFCHQATFVKREVLLNNLFDTKYRFLADFNMFRNLYINKYSFHYCPVSVAYYQIGEGQTNDNRLKCYYESAKIKGQKLSFYRVTRCKIVDLFLRSLPKSFINLIRKNRYKKNPNIVRLD